MQKKICFISTIFLFLTSFILAQEFQRFEPYNVNSPNASSLGEYGQIPVSLHTGIPNIDIPLYTVQAENIALPISISYHASGNQPEQYPSWVGLGWTLRAGGAIIRKQNGLADESGDLLRDSQNERKFGYYHNYSLLAKSNWATNYLDCSTIYGYNVSYDTEPDEFSFNFNGYSGSFYLNHEGKWIVVSDQHIVVEFNEASDLVSPNVTHPGVFSSGNEYCFYRFTLITPDGMKYVFGGTNQSIEFTRPALENSSGGIKLPTAKTWNLTEIISPDGRNIITLEYERSKEDLIVNTYVSKSSFAVNAGDICSSSISNQITMSASLTEPSYLSRIITDNCEVEFVSERTQDMKIPSTLPDLNGTSLYTFLKDWVGMVYNDIEDRPELSNDPTSDDYILDHFYLDNLNFLRKLSRIKVLKKSGAFQKSFDLTYSESLTSKLQLTMLEINSSDELGRKPFYEFTYYDDASISTPPYWSEQIDHWGFYNGRTAIFDVEEMAQYYADREPNDLNYIQEGVLKKIIYPTGGYTEFEYEKHDFNYEFVRVPDWDLVYGVIEGLSHINISELTTKETASGLRIKKITNYSGETTTAMVQEYKYVTSLSTPSISSGYLVNRPVYEWEHVLSRIFDDTESDLYVANSNSRLPLSNNSGSHVVYKDVFEVRSDDSYTHYNYTMPTSGSTSYQDLVPSGWLFNDYYLPVTSLDLERGKLKEKKVYNDQGDLLLSEVNTYNTDAYRQNDYIRTKAYYKWDICQMEHGIGGLTHTFIYFAHMGSANRIFTYPYYLEEKEVTSYDLDGNAPITTNTQYEYNDQNQLIRTITSNSTDEDVIIRNKYPGDYSLVSGTNQIAFAKSNSSQVCPGFVVDNDQLVEFNITGYSLTDGNGYDILNPLHLFEIEIYDQSSQLIRTLPVRTNSKHYIKLKEGSYTLDFNPPLSTLTYAISGNLKHYNTPNTSDQADEQSLAVYNLQKRNIISTPVESIKVIDDYDIIGGGFIKYSIQNPSSNEDEWRILPDEYLELNTASPIDVWYNNFLSTTTSEILNDIEYYTFNMSSLYNTEVYIDNYNERGKVTQYHKLNGTPTSYIWGYNGQYPIASVINAEYPEIGYLGFETDADPNNITFSSITTIPETSITSRGGYGSFINGSNIEMLGLSSSEDYKISFFANYTGQTDGIVFITGFSESFDLIKDSEWHYYETTVSGLSSIFLFSNCAFYIDDIRIYPADAQMTTYTYNPLTGMTSQTDANGNTKYYRYDARGRLIRVLDNEKNIKETYEYNYVNQ